MSDEIERTLCQLPQVHVFKIPVRKSADGHRASDWPKDPTWTGKVKIVAKGRVAAIILLDDKNQIFAVCQVTDDSAVERTLDSGRYYVLRITNAQGRHAYIGIAFNERNDAFDFNVALAEFKSELEREDLASKQAELPIGPMKDMSLKEGEKIKIKIATKKAKASEDGSSDGRSVPITTKTGGGLLPPPRSHAVAGQAVVSARQQSGVVPEKPVSGGEWADESDPFGQQDIFAPTSSNNVGKTNPSSSLGFSDPFGSDLFSSNDPFASVGSAHSNVIKGPNTGSAAAVKGSGQSKEQEINLLDL